MNEELKSLIDKLVKIQEAFYQKYGLSDIYTNSKVFEILIADELNHDLIPKLSGGRDAKCVDGEIEYKHYKETSSNHTWTFNDFSDTTIARLLLCNSVYFAHIDDTVYPPKFDWFYPVSGQKVSNYLKLATLRIQNTRKMINVGTRQIELQMGVKRVDVNTITNSKHLYRLYLDEIFTTVKKIEQIVGVKQILTSNKLWEILVSVHTGHKILTEQKKHDAVDNKGGFYEYKVSKAHSWGFEDISEAVLNKFNEEKAIILATIDKRTMSVLKIYSANPTKVIQRLKEKLQEKDERYKKVGKAVRRLQVSLSLIDLKVINAEEIFSAPLTTIKTVPV